MLELKKYPVSKNRFITICYQSNGELNDKAHGQVKKKIAKVMVENIKNLKEIYSYIHGQIIIEISSPNNKIVTTLKKVVEKLAEPMASNTPSLYYSVDLVSSNNADPKKNWIYVDGNKDMNDNFLESIKEFWPKK